MPKRNKNISPSPSKASSRTNNPVNIPYGARTDIGLVRAHNEDSLLVQPPLFVVADGMGGHQAGEIASEIATQVVSRRAPQTANAEDLARATVAANRAIIKAAEENRGREGMGTTLTAAVVEGQRIAISQVGDSRAYLLHQNNLQRITRDHSLVMELIEAGQITEEQARTHPQRSIITRALGSDPSMLPDIYEVNVSAGDRLLLCSDGLSGMVTDSRLETILIDNHDPQKCTDALISEALANGGSDNVTAIVVDITRDNEHEVKRARFRGRMGALMAALVLVLILVAGAFGFYTYAHNSAYLKLEGDVINIYQGIPGSFAGFTISEKVETADIKPADVPAGVMAELSEEGLIVSDVKEARALVKTWQDQSKEDESIRLGGEPDDAS